MTDKEFYASQNYDFRKHEEDKELNGLKPGGFTNSQKSSDVRDFNSLELNAARDIILSYLTPVRSYNKSITSYGLKHLIEKTLAKETEGQINYISNGALIFAMHTCDFKIKRESLDSPNCYFNVSQKSLNRLRLYINLNK